MLKIRIFTLSTSMLPQLTRRYDARFFISHRPITLAMLLLEVGYTDRIARGLNRPNISHKSIHIARFADTGNMELTLSDRIFESAF